MSNPSELAGQPANRRSAPGGIQRYRNAHFWMVIPFLIAVLGFARSYFLKLPEASWNQHLHGISATLWFVLVVAQPYLATHGRLKLHRHFGLAGLLLAGMVIASALNAIPANIANANLAEINPFVPPTFFYGISFYDLIAITGFGSAVLMSVLKVRDINDHAIWMFSTVFWILGAALARLLIMPAIMLHGFEGLTLTMIGYVAVAMILAALVLIMVRLRRAHPALVAAMIGNLSMFLVGPVGDNALWRSIADSVFG